MKAHTGMKRNQDVKVNILFLYFIVNFNILNDIHTMYNNHFHIQIFFKTRMPVGLL